jgi:hypothetical protein
MTVLEWMQEDIQLTHSVSILLNKLIKNNDAIPVHSSLSRFHSRHVPSISIQDYLCRILKFTQLPSCILLCILIYADRCSLLFSSLTAHRFIIAAITVASKSISDIYCTNTFFSKVGGISLQELNVLELEFLQLIQWNAVITLEEMSLYYQQLQRFQPSSSLKGFITVDD